MQIISLKKKFLFWVILFFISLIIWLSIDLVSTRIFLKFENQNIFSRIPSNIFHHNFDNNVNVIEDNSRFRNTRLITNSIGFRDKKVRKINKETTKYRIVFIGDSFTEGVLLDYEESFVGLIDNKLKDYNIEVLNAAVSSYSPSIYFAKINHFLNKNYKFDEIIVYIDIGDITDETFEDRLKISKMLDLSEKPGYSSYVVFLKKNLVITYNILNWISDWIYSERTPPHDEEKVDEFILDVVSGKKYKKDNWTINNNSFEKYKDGLDKSLKYMSLLKDLCNENNIKLTIAVYPHFTQIYHNDLDSLQVKIWQKFSLENNVNFINYFPYFIENKSPLEKRMSVIKKYFIPFDIHHNKEGSKIMANVFLERYMPIIENHN